MPKPPTTAAAPNNSASKPAASKSSDQTIAQFKAAISCTTPIIGITTADQFATMARIVERMNGNRAFISWNSSGGFEARNNLAKDYLAKFAFDGTNPWEITQPEMAVKACANAQGSSEEEGKKFGGTITFILNAQHWFDNHQFVQGICNLRDIYKGNSCCLVLLGPQLKLPPELAADVVVLDEPLPNAGELEKIVRDIHEQAELEALPENVYRAVEAIQGLSAFSAEQVTAMSLKVEDSGRKTKDGQPIPVFTELDLDALWERKRQSVEQTPGLSISREGMKFADMGGLGVAKEYLKDLLSGQARPNAIVFIDEIEKVMAGAAGDMSGVAQDQHACLLSYMQNKKCSGVLLVGHPGSGKSAIAKAAGNEVGVPTITLDLGATKGGIVGQSESQLRDALKVISAVGNDNTLWIATSNGIGSLSPELKRRFKDGIFFFDLPTPEERARIWEVHRKAYNIKPGYAQPKDDGWTGAEIEQCCRLAWRLGKSLEHAGSFVVPVSQASPDKIDALRSMADGRWLSASHPGVYRRETDAVEVAVAGPAKRKLNAGA